MITRGPRPGANFRSGYMARAAYLVDGLMNKAGLSGKSFLPLLDEPTASVEPESKALIHDAILTRTKKGEGKREISSAPRLENRQFKANTNNTNRLHKNPPGPEKVRIGG